MVGRIDNTDCYWITKTEVGKAENGVPLIAYGCAFDKNCDWAPCTIDELCCKYVGRSGLDDYIRMLLEAVGEI